LLPSSFLSLLLHSSFTLRFFLLHIHHLYISSFISVYFFPYSFIYSLISFTFFLIFKFLLSFHLSMHPCWCLSVPLVNYLSSIRLFLHFSLSTSIRSSLFPLSSFSMLSVLHNPPTQYPMSQATGSTHASGSVDSDFKSRLSNRA